MTLNKYEQQIIRKPDDKRWELSNAYFGNLTTGEEILPFAKVRYVVSGHTHCGLSGVIERTGGPPIEVSVIGSDYGKPAFILLDLPASEA